MSPTLTVLCQAASSLSGWPISTQQRGAFYTLNHVGDGDLLIVLNGLNMVCLGLILVLITFGLPSGSVSVSKFFVLLLSLPFYMIEGEKNWAKVLKSKGWRNSCWSFETRRQTGSFHWTFQLMCSPCHSANFHSKTHMQVIVFVSRFHFLWTQTTDQPPTRQ